jgi:hypothetical protein
MAVKLAIAETLQRLTRSAPPDHPIYREPMTFYNSRHKKPPSPEDEHRSTTPPTMSEAALFKRCRKALGLSLNEMASALLIAGDRNIRRWEDEHHPVSGPAWVALEYMLREADETALADRVATVIEQRR